MVKKIIAWILLIALLAPIFPVFPLEVSAKDETPQASVFINQEAPNKGAL